MAIAAHGVGSISVFLDNKGRLLGQQRPTAVAAGVLKRPNPHR